MKYKELIEKVEALPISYSWDEPYLNKEVLLEVIKQLDEPEKVVVPQFVADWYEENKDGFEYNVWRYIKNWDSQKKTEFYEWMSYASNKSLQTLVNMHQFGYEVDKGPKYIVKLKNVPYLFGILNFSKHSQKWYFSDSNTNSHHKTVHTRKELEEAGFGWVFDCEGIEIEEVQDDSKV